MKEISLGYLRRKTHRTYFWNEAAGKWTAKIKDATVYHSHRAAIKADVEAERARAKDPRLSGPGEMPPHPTDGAWTVKQGTLEEFKQAMYNNPGT